MVRDPAFRPLPRHKDQARSRTVRDDRRAKTSAARNVPRGACKNIRQAYFSASATLAMPALTQASSLSPPGAPEAPAAPITSLPALIGTPPAA